MIGIANHEYEFEYTEHSEIEDLIREGLRPGDHYFHYENGVSVFDPREWFSGGSIPEELLVPSVWKGYGEQQ